jgi:hypothetical protein
VSERSDLPERWLVTPGVAAGDGFEGRALIMGGRDCAVSRNQAQAERRWASISPISAV